MSAVRVMVLWAPKGSGPDDFAVDVPRGWRVHSVIEVMPPDIRGQGVRVLLEVDRDYVDPRL